MHGKVTGWARGKSIKAAVSAAMAIVLTGGIVTRPAVAASATWTGATDADWFTPANWSTGAFPGTIAPASAINADIAFFNGTATYTTVTFGQAGLNMGGVTFGASAAAPTTGIAAVSSFTLGMTAGNGISLSSGGRIQNIAATPASALLATYTIAAPISIANGGGSATGAGTYTFDASGGSTSATQNAFLQITGSVAGNASVGSNTTLTLTGNNNIRGLTTGVINAVTGKISDGTNGGTLSLAFTTPGGNNSTTWLLAGANDYTGGTTLTRAGSSTGTLRVSNNSALGSGSVTFNGLANLQQAAGSSLTLANAINFAANTGSIDSNGSAMAITGALSGPGTWAKAGTGTLTLSNTANTFGGAVTVSGGTLAGVGNHAFGSTAGITLTAAGTLSLLGNSSTAFTKASNDAAYAVSTSATGATLNVDQATSAGTAAKTMTIGTIGTTSVAATYALNFTGANNTGLSTGLITGPASTAAATVTLNNTNVAGTTTLAGYTSLNSTGGETLTFSGNGNTTLSGAITPSATVLGLSKNGTGTLTLNAASGYTGATAINAGTVKIGNATALGTTAGITTVGTGATLDLNGQSIAESLGVSGTSGISGSGVGGNGALVNTGSPAAIASTILTNSSFTVGGAGDIALETVVRASGSGAFTLTKIGTGQLTLGGTADNALLAGTVNAGTVVLNKNSTAGAHVFNALTVAGGTVQFGANQVTGGASTVGGQVNSLTIDGGTVDLNGSGGKNATVTTLAGAGGTVTNTAATPATLTFGVNNVAGSYAGVIQNGIGSVAIAKSGTATQTLTGNNTYTGGTTIHGGELRANNANSSTGSGAVTVGNGSTLTGTLGGNGTIANGTNAVTINKGSTITAGADSVTTGRLTLGDAAWAGGAKYNWKLANAAAPVGGVAGAWDELAMGTLNLTNVSSSNRFIIVALGSNAMLMAPQSFRIADVTGVTLPGGTAIADLFTLDASALVDASHPATNFQLTFGGDGDIFLAYGDPQGAPEPTTMALFGLGGSVLIGRRRRRTAIRS